MTNDDSKLDKDIEDRNKNKADKILHYREYDEQSINKFESGRVENIKIRFIDREIGSIRSNYIMIRKFLKNLKEYIKSFFTRKKLDEIKSFFAFKDFSENNYKNDVRNSSNFEENENRIKH